MSQADRPLVSVVVATNRGGPFLVEALASLLTQSYPHVEIVLVDDGSPDPDVLRGVTDDFPDVRVHRIEPSGVSVARNTGVALSGGELIAFLDDDDVWHPDRLRHHVEVMAADPTCVLSYCRMSTIDADGKQLVAADQEPVRDIHDVIRGTTGILLPNVVLRRTCFDSLGGFDPAYRYGEDMDLILRAARLGTVGFVQHDLVGYRHHVANTTSKHRVLSAGIRDILRAHRASARAEGRADLAADYTHRLRANDRFAAWSAARAGRAHLAQRRYRAAAGEMFWAARFAPAAPLSWARTRLARGLSKRRPTTS